MSFRKRAITIISNVAIMLVIFLAITAFQTRNMLSTSATPAPDLSGPLLHGGEYSLADAAARPVLVYFFAPWCKFCSVASDNLVRLRRLRDEEALEIITVALDWQTADEVRDYVDRHDLDLPVIMGSRKLWSDWQVYAFPTYYVLDSQHRISRRDLGYSTQLGLLWRTWLVD